MVDHSLESLFWIRKDDMLTKYRIGAQIKDKDAKSICYVFFKLFPKFEIVYIIQGGRDVKKIRDFFFLHFLACFFDGSEILSHLENIKSKIYENLTFNFCHTRAPSWILSSAENLASSNLQDGATKW